MTRFHVVNTRHINYLYHWQRFVPDRLVTLLRDRVIWCNQPDDFNDPWDCKPSYNTEILRDEAERERHIEWYAQITRRHRPDIPSEFIEQAQEELRADTELLIKRIEECSVGMWSAVAERYRVYCLGPDVHNTLMWAHYADSHKGVCLEFSTRNEVICCALQVEYSPKFPLMSAYSDGEDENLIPLLTKSDVWSYEQEYRLVAQERSFATAHETLMTENNYLILPKGALTSIIVGCQGQFDEVRELVSKHAPDVLIKQAERIPNRYALRIRTTY